MSATQGQDTTLLIELRRQLQACTSTSDGVEPPAAILWTDPKGHWKLLESALLEAIPELLVYGEYNPESRTGPAIWLRCMIDRALETPEIPEDAVPIIYLPRVGRQDLRAGEECPDALKPLVELMYRGTLWLQKSGNDWTATAFTKGLGLDLSGDTQTTEALLGALPIFASESVGNFRGQRLEASDFHQMLSSDPKRDLLRWMANPAGTREPMSDDSWDAFCNQCREQFDFDPENDSEITAGERLGKAAGAWADLWERFEEAPGNYRAIIDLLRRSKPGELIFDLSHWPDENDSKEEEVRQAFAGLKELSRADACDKLLELEKEHAIRRSWVWNRLELSPMAGVLVPLAELARHTKSAIGGQSPDNIARTYVESGWQADRASWQTVDMTPEVDKEIIYGVVQQLLQPWLDESARAFQASMTDCPLPDHSNAAPVTVPEGGCLLFADGLRYDLGEVLRDRLEARGCRVKMNYRWAAAPTVTATAKPAVTPIAAAISGKELPTDFTPRMSDSQKPANAIALREELRQAGYQLLSDSILLSPESGTARGWTEDGQIDKRGHQLQIDLAGLLEKEVDRLTDRIISLLDAGWSMVRVVTDHGWLYLPLGLPKVDLPKHLTASKWARCATISGQSKVDVPTASWHWNPTEYFATGPGISCFNANNIYAHGGLSIQECLTPDLHIERSGDSRDRASIESVIWKRMRCFVVAADCSAEVQADLRLGTPAGPSVAASIKQIDADGAASLLLEDDTHESADLVVVLLGSDGSVLAQHKTKVGINS